MYIIPSTGGIPTKLAEATTEVGVDGLGERWNIGTTFGITRDNRHLTSLPVNGEPLRQLTSGAGVLGSVALASGTDAMAFTWQTTDTPADV
ncbi:MAG: hypothetical protein CM1200mP14_22900 [Gammaproteobacteria bacterium]|nr:MAG: hypothetical protein CM1200mP14_22900 [Gammaproteobacteria bacterium]